jgi:hypothetical protein
MEDLFNITHRELCQIGAQWLLNQKHWDFRCQYVCVELVTISSETPDIFGLKGGIETILLEVKVSRSDFLADLKKPHRKGGGIGSERYYLCPDGLIREDELPANWGLLYYKDGNITVIKQATPYESKDLINEMSIMYSIIRRTIKKRQILDFRQK